MSTFTIFLVLITIVCFLLIIVVMVQNPKGGGLSSALGGTQQLGGVQKTTDFLDKSTWVLGAALIVLVLLSSMSFPGSGGSTDKIIDASQSAAPAPEDAKEAKPGDANTKPAETPATPEKK
ncbi:preprotein translocase subunit SecG [Flavobacterium sp.]|jgi:preprotein translocase subunit SecG|uniref:preprotein translocase subunit SecG n=1 Tax=Flavobacterium sp. TaxID=239 RepID=UPI0022CB8E6F|nr:preprotein translocase subunit SecG [Flavobacterium sp.]MCZ8143939.1 preprotein translocase subunit SecG [Flavobacterium sp.]MCZ8367317.1 preprotein translocase subunit SecG [Flavobacterium sp.]